MIQRIIVFLFLISLFSNTLKAQELKGYMTYKCYGINNGKEAEGFINFIGITMINAFEKVYPCLLITTERDLNDMLNLERQKALLGNKNQVGVESIGEALGAQYLILISIGVFEDSYFLKASFNDKKIVMTLAQSVISAPKSSLTEKTDELIKSLLEQLEHYEICPFKGAIGLEVTSITDTVKKEEYMVYCNDSEYAFKKEEVIYSKSSSDWQLEKTNKKHAIGNVSYTISEFNSTTEDNPCYKCKSGREGGRTYKASKSFNVNQTGLSFESKVDEKAHADARVNLKFLDNDTYTITIEATTDKYTTSEKWKIEAIGTCDNISPESKENERLITAFANQIFGPYPGKASDKNLSQEETREWYDPIAGERTTVTINFNLTSE